MTIGTYPAIGLATARELAREALEQVARGIDPAATKAKAGGKSFRAIVDAVHRTVRQGHGRKRGARPSACFASKPSRSGATARSPRSLATTSTSASTRSSIAARRARESLLRRLAPVLQLVRRRRLHRALAVRARPPQGAADAARSHPDRRRNPRLLGGVGAARMAGRRVPETLARHRAAPRRGRGRPLGRDRPGRPALGDPARTNEVRRAARGAVVELAMEIIDRLPRTGAFLFPGRRSGVEVPIGSFGQIKHKTDALIREAGHELPRWTLHDLRTDLPIEHEPLARPVRGRRGGPGARLSRRGRDIRPAHVPRRESARR